MAGFSYSKPYVHPVGKTVTPPASPASAPVATGGKPQAPSARGPKAPKAPKTVSVKAHTRTVQPKAKAPVNPDQALINAAVRLHFGPQEQAINQGLAQNARFASGTGDWYSNALNEIAGLRNQGAQQSAQTLGQITSYNSNPALNNATDQQAAGARNNLNAEFAAMFGRDANANSDAMNRLQAAYGVQQGNTMNQTNAQRQQLIAQKGQLGSQKADFGLQYGSQLQAAEQKAAADALKSQIAADALNVKVKTLNDVQIPLAKSLSNDRTQSQRVARTNARTQRIKMRNSQMNSDKQFQLDKTKVGLEQAKQNWQETHPKPSDQKAAADLKFFNKHGYYPPTGPPSSKTKAGSKPTVAQTKQTQAILDAKARYVTGIQHKESLSSIANQGRSHGVSETILQIGSYLATHHGRMNASVRQKIRALGVDPNSL